MTLEHLTNETFKEKVFNYEANKDWKFEGEIPAIIDFYLLLFAAVHADIPLRIGLLQDRRKILCHFNEECKSFVVGGQ